MTSTIISRRFTAVAKNGCLVLLAASLQLLTMPAAAQSNFALAYTFTTFAGKPSAGSADGVGDAAQFKSPYGVGLDSAGNVYVADSQNNTIRKVTSAGVVSTLAGLAGISGTNDGTCSNARFNYPSGIAVDSEGNVYVLDTLNNTIRKVAPTGTNWAVTTIAGLPGTHGSADGTNSAARFEQPFGLAVDSAGSVYVADTLNHTIRKVTAAGVVSTLAGSAGTSGTNDGTGINAQFNSPYGLAVDNADNLYVADTYNCTIRKVTAAGVVSTLAGNASVIDGLGFVIGGSTDGTGSNAQFNYPYGVAVDSAGSLYVADSFNFTIRKITPVGTNWVVSTLAGAVQNGGCGDGTGSNGRFNYPSGIAVDSAGNLYVTDANNTIRKTAPTGTNWVVSTIAGECATSGSADGEGGGAQFYSPQGVAADSAGNVYVADTGNNTIRKITPAGTNWIVSTLGGSPLSQRSADGTGSKARFYTPFGVAVNSAGVVYVADTGNNTIRKGVFTQYTPANALPFVPPAMDGQLTVTLQPPEANGQWRFPWEFGWHNSGTTASNLVQGNYPIEFRSVPGYLALPTQPVQVTSGGTTVITNDYLPTISAGDANSTPGSLTVFLGKTPPVGAGWRFLGDGGSFFANAFTTNLLPGTYLIEFALVSGRIKPPNQAVQVNPAVASYLSVNYPLAATPPGGVYLPFLVPANQVADENTYPFGFNGQLQSDTGYGSGVAVQANVVLTAAHLVFNDQTLAYVSRAHWFFRRDAGVSPDGSGLPQAARSFYLLSGYAAQRTNDLASGYFPEQSTPPSRNLDVAALYFLLAVAGGGHGGYLPSDAVPNTWLTSIELKMLVGYPVDGSQFGDASIVPGKMYQTDPQPYPLSIATDPVSGQQEVYVAPWFLSYPGNSGGPLYLQLNGYYYPALGTLFSGSQPYASVVRAIDSDVVNLITIAASEGASGTNHTGGGVITIIPNQNISASTPRYVQFQLAPPAAVQAGAAWRLQGDSSYSTAPSYTRAVISTNAFAVEFKPIAGWNLPTNQTTTILPGVLITNIAFYTVTNPVLVVDAAFGLGITGTTGTLYRIESRPSLSSGAWTPLSTNTILSNGLNPVLPMLPSSPPTTYYRAVWLPNL